MKARHHKSVVKVSIDTDKSRTKIMTAVAELEGGDVLSIDVETETVTVIGVVDPVQIAKQLRKIKMSANLVSVGSPNPA